MAGDLEVVPPSPGSIMLLSWRNGHFRHRDGMTDLRQHFRWLWIALAAMAGMFWTVDDAWASTASGASRKVADACCAKRVCAGCCCAPASASTRSEVPERSEALLSMGAALTTPAQPCECRSSEPVSPASRQESRSYEDRAGQSRSESVDFAVHAPASLTLAYLISPTSIPPKSPLYLSIARLLI
jgi:hypothetical protein